MVATIPEQITPQCLGDYLEIMTRAVFQAGVSWAQIANKWVDYRIAFEHFDVETVAEFDEEDVNRLMVHPGIMHSRKKILATIKNARTILELDKQHNGFQNYLRSKNSYEELSKDMKKRFGFMGEMSVYYLLFLVKEPVPDFEEWSASIKEDHPRMREMVQLAANK